VPAGTDAETLAVAVRIAVAPQNRPRVERAAALAATRYSAEAMGRAWGDYLCGLADPRINAPPARPIRPEPAAADRPKIRAGGWTTGERSFRSA
jgi:hypothetical protein